MSVVGSAIIGTLVSIAAKVGAKQVEKYLGKGAGGVAGTIIEAIAESVGVTVPELDRVPEAELERAVLEIERVTPEMVRAWTDGQREANRLMLAEMDKGDTFSWWWRPAMMYLLAFFWAWSLVLVPVVNALAGAAIPTFFDELIWVTTTYLALYMGGHTLKDGIANWRATREAQAK